jgi:acetyl esterase/lipase
VTVEVEPTEAPDFSELADAAAIAGMIGYYTPLLPPAGATELTRAEYKPGLHIWTYGRAGASGLSGDRSGAPGVLFVHGGGWGGGDPSFHARHAHQLAERGYVTAFIEYRLTPVAPWPAQLDDVNDAVAWLRAAAPGLGLDPGRLAVAGGSAGGHLAAMAALSPGSSGPVQAAVLWYPAVDLRSFDAIEDARVMTDALLPGASADDLLAASPLSRVTAEAPPVLSMTGDLDWLTTVADISAFHGLLDDVGVRNELVVFKGREHGFDYHPADWQVCFERMAAFLDSALQAQTTL